MACIGDGKLRWRNGSHLHANVAAIQRASHNTQRETSGTTAGPVPSSYPCMSGSARTAIGAQLLRLWPSVASPAPQQFHRCGLSSNSSTCTGSKGMRACRPQVC